MLVKFFKCNPETGKLFKGATGAIDYLMSEKGRSVAPEVLAGNPDIARDLVNQSEYSKPYTAGVLSFEEENIPFADKLELMESFEQTLLAGLDKEQYDICWIEHRDKDRLELNFHIVNTELSTGKRLQPFWKGRDLPRVDAWKQLVNDKHGYASPDDPKRSRTIQFGNNSPSRKEVLEKVDEYIFPMIESGEIKNPDDLKQKLNDVPSINVIKQTKSGTTIKVDDFEKNIRLKGDFYGKHFSGFGRIEEVQKARSRRYNKKRNQRIADNKKRLREGNKRISEQRREQYRKPDTERIKEVEPHIEGQQQEHDISSDISNSINHELDIVRDGRQPDNKELLRNEHTAVHGCGEERRDISLQNETNSINQEVVNKNEPSSIRKPQEHEERINREVQRGNEEIRRNEPAIQRNESRGRRFVEGVQRLFGAIMERVSIVRERVNQGARSSEATREQYALAATKCGQANRDLEQAITRKLLPPKQQPQPRTRQKRTRDHGGLEL